MPKQSIDFSKTVIYKIQHKEIDDLLYVGSTTNFTQRKSSHKGGCNNANCYEYNYKLYQTIRDNGGWDMFNMVIIKHFPCQNFNEARTEEDKVMREMKSNLNMKRAYVSPEEKQEYLREYRLENKDKNKQYYLEHKDELAESHRQYYTEHKDEIVEYQKQYRLENKDKIKDKIKQWKLENKDKIKEKFECPCGGKYTYEYKSGHFKTKKHQNYLKNNP
jgi:hypothetical protein